MSKRIEVASHSTTYDDALDARADTQILEHYLHLFGLKLMESNLLVLEREVGASALVKKDRDNLCIVRPHDLLQYTAAFELSLIVHQEAAGRRIDNFFFLRWVFRVAVRRLTTLLSLLRQHIPDSCVHHQSVEHDFDLLHAHQLHLESRVFCSKILT